MGLKEQIQELVEGFISEDESLFIVEISLGGRSGAQKLRITMDGDNGITIDQCASISRRLGAKIEEMELIDDKYLLEVSSAGVEAPMKLERQYLKNVGRTLKVKLVTEEVVEGKLLAFEKDCIEIEVGSESRKIEMKEIEKSVIVVSFK